MNHYSSLATRYLKGQKKRSVLTVLGIILSVALLLSTSIMGESLKARMLDDILHSNGNVHATFTGMDEEKARLLKDYAKTEAVGIRSRVGNQLLRGGLSLTVLGADAEYLDMMYLKLAQGRLPQEPGEIAMEQWALDNLGGLKLGDKLTVDLRAIEPGQPDDAQKPIHAEFTITGVFESPKSGQLSGTATGVVALNAVSTYLPEKSVQYDAAVRIKKGLSIQATLNEIKSRVQAKDMFENRSLLTALGQSGNDSNNNAVNLIETIVIGIILAATLAVIYNAFHISVVERIRQFGVLRSIGMTPRQIRGIVFREATMLSAVGIPLGLLAGIGAVAVILAIFRTMSGTLFGGARLTMPWYLPVGAALLGLLAVYGSAFLPARAAGKVSPLEAVLRNNRFRKDRIIRRKRRLTTALLGIPGKLAADNLQRNKRRFRVTVFSMSIGIALFVIFTSFMSYIRLSESRYFYKDFAIDEIHEQMPNLTEEDYKAVAALPGVRKVYRVMHASSDVSIPADRASQAYRSSKAVLPVGPEGSVYAVGGHVFGYRNDELELVRPRLIEGAIRPDEMDRVNGVIIAQTMQLPEGRTQVSNFHVGDEIELKWPVADDQSASVPPRKQVLVKVLGIVDKPPMRYSSLNESFTVITTEHVFEAITGTDKFARFDIEMGPGAEPSQLKGELYDITAKKSGALLQDFDQKDSRNVELQIAILLYGLVTVISVISAINIINTISTNLILRTRELGTLRAVGMTMRQMNRMILIEGVWYGVYATVIGGLAGAGLGRLLYNQFNTLQDLPYHLPLMQISAAGAASILVGWLSSRIPLKRLAALDVAQAVRAEE